MLEPCAAVIYSSFLASRPTTGTCTSTRSFVRVFVQSMESALSIDHRVRLHRKRHPKHAAFPVDVHLWQLFTTDAGAKCRLGEKSSSERQYPEIPVVIQTRSSESCRGHLRSNHALSNHHFSRHSFHHAPSKSSTSTRSISTAAALSYKPSSVHIRRYSEDARAELDNFRRLLDESDDLDQCWDSYIELQELEMDHLLELADLFDLASRIAEDSDLFDMPKDARSEEIWQVACTRLTSLVKKLEGFKPFNSSFDYHRFRMLEAQSYCLQGEVPTAGKMIYGTFARITHRAETAPHDIATFLHLILCYWRFKSPEEALNTFIANRTTMAAILNPGRKDSGNHLLMPSSEASPFSPLMEQIVLSIRHPISFFIKNRDTWPTHRKQLIAALVITFLCRARLSLDSYGILAEIHEQGAQLGINIRHDIVRALVRDKHLEEARSLYKSINLPDDAKLSFRRNQLLVGLKLYSRLGDVQRTEEIYAQLRTLGYGGPVEVTAVLQAYVIAGKLQQAVDLFYEFFEAPSSRLRPNRIHYTVLVAGHAHQSDHGGMNEWLEKMASRGFQPDLVVYNICLKSLAMQGEVESIGTLLASMHHAGVKPDGYSYTSVIALLAERRDPVAAEALYRRAIDEGITPDVRMIVSVMNAHVEAGLWQGVIRVFDYLRTVPVRQLHLTIGVYNTLLKAYVLIGAPFSVVSKLFSRLEGAGIKPDDYTYTLLIQSACDAGDMDAAARLFDDLDHAYERSHANVYVLTIILAGFLRQGEREKARTVYDQMLARNIQPTSLTYATILRAYANEGTQESLRIAQDFLTSLIDSDVGAKLLTEPLQGGHFQPIESVHLPLLHAYTKLDDVANAEKTMQSVLDAGGRPTMVGLTSLMNVYRRTGNIDAVVDVWGQILELGLRHSNVEALFEGTDVKYERKRQTNLLCVALSIYIDALSRAGRHLEIAKVWSELRGHGFQFDSHNWNHLTVALVRAGEPERAFEIVEKVIYVYREQFLDIQGSRPKRPHSPLYFDNFEGTNESEEEEEIPASEDPMHNTKKRASVVMRAKRRLEIALHRYREEEEDEQLEEDEANRLEGQRQTDFAHPLHIMHQVSPTWDVWRPHASTLRYLGGVLEDLRAGKLIKAIKPSAQAPGEFEDEPYDEDEDEEYLEPEEFEQQQKVAHDTFDRIVEKYPQTVEAAEKYRRSQSKVFRRYGTVQ